MDWLYLSLQLQQYYSIATLIHIQYSHTITVGSTGTLVSSELDRTSDADGGDTLKSTNQESSVLNGEGSTDLVNEDYDDDHIPMSISGIFLLLSLSGLFIIYNYVLDAIMTSFWN